MTKRKTPRRKPLSRLKYEEGHPNVSARVTREFYERLCEIRERDGVSFADVLKVGAGLQEAASRKASEEAFAEAKRTYLVRFSCQVCRKWIEVSAENTRAAARDYFEQNGWGHPECHERTSRTGG